MSAPNPSSAPHTSFFVPGSDTPQGDYVYPFWHVIKTYLTASGFADERLRQIASAGAWLAELEEEFARGQIDAPTALKKVNATSGLYGEVCADLMLLQGHPVQCERLNEAMQQLQNETNWFRNFDLAGEPRPKKSRGIPPLKPRSYE